MGTVSARTRKSTIGRTHAKFARPLRLHCRGHGARCRHSFRLLTAVRSWVHDPLGIAADFEDWNLDEEEVRADLEYGRD